MRSETQIQGYLLVDMIYAKSRREDNGPLPLVSCFLLQSVLGDCERVSITSQAPAIVLGVRLQAATQRTYKLFPKSHLHIIHGA